VRELPSRILFTAGVLLAVACGASRYDALSQEVHDLQTWTVPPRATLMAASGLRREGWTAEATWDIETEMRWEEYTQWVRSQPLGFSGVTLNGSALRFTKSRAEDMYVLHIEAVSVGPPLHLRVTFQGFPS
jgi:hypothetical protein